MSTFKAKIYPFKKLSEVLIDEKCLQLSVQGTLRDVESCRDKINIALKDYPHILLVDAAANEVRQQAYPILAKIELSLRQFINRAASEIIGCDWWNTITPFLSQPDIQQTERKLKPHEVYHDLDLLYFNDLVRLITGYYQKLPDDKMLSVDDLMKILDGCDSVQEVQAKLEKETCKTSLWDVIFSRYIKDKVRWNSLGGSITEVIDIRNRVMHHRSVSQHELDKLRDVEREVDELLASAKDRLTEDDLIEVTSIFLPAFAEAARISREQLYKDIGEYVKFVVEKS